MGKTFWEKLEDFKDHLNDNAGCLILIGSIILFVAYFNWLNSCEEERQIKSERYYNYSYEKACEHNDFAIAHELLTKLKDEAESSQRWYNNYKIERKAIKHWFKENEEIVDQASVEEKESRKEEMEQDALKYLIGVEYIYNAEMTYIMASNDEDKEQRIDHLLRELKAQLMWFTGSSLSKNANEVYERIRGLTNLKDSID